MGLPLSENGIANTGDTTAGENIGEGAESTWLLPPPAAAMVAVVVAAVVGLVVVV